MRNTFCLIFSLVLIISCNNHVSTQTNQIETSIIDNPVVDTSYIWTKLTEHAAFPKSYNFQLFVIHDTLWVMHHDAAYFSLNGKEWNRASLSNVILNNAFLPYVWFENALYGLGTFSGNIEHYTMTSAIYKTADMRNWERLADHSNLPSRFFYHPFVFKNKIWIIGGGTEHEMFNDIWSSGDAVHWKKEADGLPFTKRQGSQFVIFHNKIFMLDNDVWSSEDAIHWTKVADRIAPENVFGYSATVFDNKIWLIGCNRNNLFKSEVLISADGKNWHAASAPWSPRGGTASCVYHNKIFMTGGKYGGLPNAPDFVYSNDVWTLEKK